MSSGPQSKPHASLGYIGQHPVSDQPFLSHPLKMGHRTRPAVKLRIPRDLATVNLGEPAPGGVTSVNTSTSLTSTVRPPPAGLFPKELQQGADSNFQRRPRAEQPRRVLPSERNATSPVWWPSKLLRNRVEVKPRNPSEVRNFKLQRFQPPNAA